MILRSTVRAVIVEQGALLVLEKRYPDGADAFALPGGAQEPGESLADALIRECVEEIDTPVEPGALAYVFEHLKRPRTLAKPVRHKVEVGIRCVLPVGATPRMGPSPDPHQVGVRWLPLDAVADALLTPVGLSPYLLAYLRDGVPLLGGTVPGR